MNQLSIKQIYEILNSLIDIMPILSPEIHPRNLPES